MFLAKMVNEFAAKNDKRKAHLSYVVVPLVFVYMSLGQTKTRKAVDQESEAIKGRGQNHFQEDADDPPNNPGDQKALNYKAALVKSPKKTKTPAMEACGLWQRCPG